jgi:hypothetical protein
MSLGSISYPNFSESTFPNVGGVNIAFYGTIRLATRGREDTRMAEQVRKISYQAIPEWVP